MALSPLSHEIRGLINKQISNKKWAKKRNKKSLFLTYLIDYFLYMGIYSFEANSFHGTDVFRIDAQLNPTTLERLLKSDE